MTYSFVRSLLLSWGRRKAKLRRTSRTGISSKTPAAGGKRWSWVLHAEHQSTWSLGAEPWEDINSFLCTLFVVFVWLRGDFSPFAPSWFHHWWSWLLIKYPPKGMRSAQGQSSWKRSKEILGRAVYGKYQNHYWTNIGLKCLGESVLKFLMQLPKAIFFRNS